MNAISTIFSSVGLRVSDETLAPTIQWEFETLLRHGKLPEIPEIDGEIEYDRDLRKLIGAPVISDGDFAIDSDDIAWKIYHDENY